MSPRTTERVRREIRILSREIGGVGHGGDRIKLGRVTVRKVDYIGLLIRSIGVDPRVFRGAKSVNILLLIPGDYPRTPPVGCYVDRPYDVRSSHFVGSGYHGAPTLERDGWRGFCHAVGGWSARSGASPWRPATRPEEGHNLATVVAASRLRMSSGS